jgi:hypothetical protein
MLDLLRASALPLLVAGVDAKNANHARPPNDLAVLANSLH